MKRLKHIIFLAIAIVGISAIPLASSHATVDINTAKKETAAGACEQKGGTVSNGNCSVGGSSLSGIFVTVANILLFLVGAVAVIMLIVGGFRYVTSNGDQNAVTGAKNTILYAIIGIVVAFLAFAAVNFVVEALTKKPTESSNTSSSIHKTSMV